VYVVVWLSGKATIGSTQMTSLAVAKQYVTGQFPSMQDKHGVTSVEVRDDNDESAVVFRLPEKAD
jgi:hypothetical protein